MKGIWGIIFIGCFYAFATLNVANAVDCSTFTTKETCETDANTGCIYYVSLSKCDDCGPNSYRDKKSDGSYECKTCPEGFETPDRSQDGINSCYRKCKPGDPISTGINKEAEWHAQDGVEEQWGKYYSDGTSTCTVARCLPGYLRLQSTEICNEFGSSALFCMKCPDGYPNTDKNDGYSACSENLYEKARTQCYSNTCPSKSVDNSTSVKTNKLYYPNTTCTYNVTCKDSDANGCSRIGYSVIKNDTANPSCVPMVADCKTDNGTDGKKFVTGFSGSSPVYTQCLTPRSNCNEDTHQFAGNRSCDTLYDYGTCMPKEIDCKTYSAYTQTCQNTFSSSSVRVDGKIQLNNYGYYTIDNNCRCVRTDDIVESDKPIGKIEYYYKFKRNGNQLEDVPETIEVISCIKGYCAKDYEDTCSKASEGFYHDNDTSKECQACPSKSTTSSEGATSKNDCHFTSGTVFLDDNGTFTIPNMSTVKVYWGTP